MRFLENDNMPENANSFADESSRTLPPYTYLPGITPHPVSDACGHSFGKPSETSSGDLQHGIELFNNGFYWEAHEAWEAEWMAVGRTGPRADFIKGMIKLAACGVKCLERNPAGAARHARRAKELFQQSLHPDVLALLPITSETVTALLAFVERQLDSPPLATEEHQQAARVGGVPILGALPLIR